MKNEIGVLLVSDHTILMDVKMDGIDGIETAER